MLQGTSPISEKTNLVSHQSTGNLCLHHCSLYLLRIKCYWLPSPFLVATHVTRNIGSTEIKLLAWRPQVQFVSDSSRSYLEVTFGLHVNKSYDCWLLTNKSSRCRTISHMCIDQAVTVVHDTPAGNTDGNDLLFFLGAGHVTKSHSLSNVLHHSSEGTSWDYPCTWWERLWQ